jgi:hypothetical protein
MVYAHPATGGELYPVFRRRSRPHLAILGGIEDRAVVRHRAPVGVEVRVDGATLGALTIANRGGMQWTLVDTSRIGEGLHRVDPCSPRRTTPHARPVSTVWCSVLDDTSVRRQLRPGRRPR